MRIRLAIVVSHPIQYYVPLYRRLAGRDDLEIKVFFTWHAGESPVPDHGFRRSIAWDISLASGYPFERVENVAADPGTHHFRGLRNPALVQRVLAWNPDAVHVTGWAWQSHLSALHALHLRDVATLFRGDSHLLDAPLHGLRWQLKRRVLKRVYSWPAAFLCVGSANRDYYEAFGVDPARLFPCPHSIDVPRFSERSQELEREAAGWRASLRIAETQPVVLFAGKFERKKRPLELMRAVRSLADPSVVLLMVGDGELRRDVDRMAAQHPSRLRVLPFQNQSRMPLVYRLGDLFVLPSSHGETWGLAVNEAMASGRPVLVSDRVGCAADLVDPSRGRVFPWNDLDEMARALNEMMADRTALHSMGRIAARRAPEFDTAMSEEALMACLRRLQPR